MTRRQAGPGTFNASTLVTTHATPYTVYSGQAFYSDRLSGHPRDEGYADLREHHGVVRFPLPCPDFAVDDEIRFTSGPCEGMTFIVEAIENQSFEVTRRVRVVRTDAEVMRS